jgi:hypothetical protein
MSPVPIFPQHSAEVAQHGQRRRTEAPIPQGFVGSNPTLRTLFATSCQRILIKFYFPIGSSVDSGTALLDFRFLHNPLNSTWLSSTTNQTNILVKPKPSTPQPNSKKNNLKQKSNKPHNPKDVQQKKPTTTQRKNNKAH